MLFDVHEGCAAALWDGVCSWSTTSSLTCNRPTSSSSMLRCSILPRFTASARIAKAPIAKAPIAVAPTATAPIESRLKATCAPERKRFAHVSLVASSSAPFLPQRCGIDKAMMPPKDCGCELRRTSSTHSGERIPFVCGLAGGRAVRKVDNLGIYLPRESPTMKEC